AVREQNKHVELALGEGDDEDRQSGATRYVGVALGAVELVCQPPEVGERDSAGLNTLEGSVRDKEADQGCHRRAFVDEDADVVFWVGQRQRSRQGDGRIGLVTARGEGQRAQRLDLDQAANAAL